MERLYEGYLTQEKLSSIIKSLVPESDWLGTEIKLPKSKRRFDFGYNLNGKKYLVEFDGSQHYQNALQIKTDIEKDELCECYGYTIIRFPYWLQLTTQTLKSFFHINCEFESIYPHGFIDKNAVLPASYCQLGVNRFLGELSTVDDNIKNDIITSLYNHMDKLQKRYVVPDEMFPLFSTFIINHKWINDSLTDMKNLYFNMIPEWFIEYKTIGGMDTNDEFNKHILVFCAIIPPAFANDGIKLYEKNGYWSGRFEAIECWEDYIGEENNVNNAALYFRAVDKISSLS